ncbi:hypothetical protein [Actinoallomurus rhizosphaericola]|nr:hypothetical protein [Actinoallomurus rhizosphaericola]
MSDGLVPCHHWQTFTDRRPGTAWINAMADGARRWADHRGLTVTR